MLAQYLVIPPLMAAIHHKFSLGATFAIVGFGFGSLTALFGMRRAKPAPGNARGYGSWKAARTMRVPLFLIGIIGLIMLLISRF